MPYIILLSFFFFVPILVHLFNFKRTKTYFFSNINFITHVVNKYKKKKQLKQYLVLFSRILIFSFLFTVLFVEYRNLEKTQEENKVIYLDNSISQSTKIAQTSSLELGKAVVSFLLDKQSEKLVFLTNEFSPFSNISRTPKEVKKELNQIGFVYLSRPISSIINRTTPFDNDYLAIISDFQQTNQDDILKMSLDTGKFYDLFVSPIQTKKNVFIDSIYLVPRVDDSRILYSLKVLVKHNYEDFTGNIIIQLINNGKQISSIVKPISELSEIAFDILKANVGHFELRISGDEIVFDNTFYFLLTEKKQINIVTLSDTPNTYLNQIFKNETLFYYTGMLEKEINYEVLNRADLLILNNFQTLPKAVFLASDSVPKIVFPSNDINFESYNKLLGWQPKKVEDTNRYEFKIVDERPLFSKIFTKQNTDAQLPSASCLYQLPQFSDPLIELRNGNKYLSKMFNKEIYLFSSPLTLDYTDLPINAFFIPLMYRMAQTATMQKDELYYYPRQKIILNTSSKEKPIEIRGKNYQTIPDFNVFDEGIILTIPQDIVPGFYNCIQEQDTVYQFAINLSKEESKSSIINTDYLEEFFSNSDHIRINQLSSNLTTHSVNIEKKSQFWKYALMIAILFVFSESLLHKYLQ